MYASTLFVTALSLAGFVSAQTSAANPFAAAGIPDLSTLGICGTECATVSQVNNNWNGDYSQLCTSTFSAALANCMQCVARSAIGAVVLTPENENTLEAAINSYEAQCAQSGSPVTIDVSSILAAATSPGASAGSGTSTGTAAIPSNTNAASSARNLGFAGLAGLVGVVSYSLSL